MSEIPARLTATLADRYRLERELGAGGMATVYLAEDLKHQRKVAIKVLRPELAAVIGAERFLSEIRTTANLQHPHILPLFDSGQADSFLFYVMPFIEGESLRDRLNRDTQLPIDEAVRIATEIAGALDYAHRHNVIHRDIKPENVLLHDGRALVADFGIALAASKAGGTRMTETGMSLGTPTYMSPEQAMGEREITARSDVYALGCVTYEMLIGEPPFTGPTAQAIVAKVMTAEPTSLSGQRKSIPEPVESAVLTALEKLPADRFASAAEFAAALKGEGSATRRLVGAGSRARADEPPSRRVFLYACLAGTALGVAAAMLVLHRSTPPPPVTRYGLALAQAPTSGMSVNPSPDGASLAYVSPAEVGVTKIWIKRRDRYEATALAETENVTNFTWSPDGQWLAFTQGQHLRKIPIAGGAVITLADSASSNPGIAWLDDGTIVFILLGGGRGLVRVPSGGGKATVVLRDSTMLIFPAPLPGSRGVLYTRCSGSCVRGEAVWALDLHSGATHQVVAGAAMGQYLPTGHLVFVRPDGAMLAAKFNLNTLLVEGAPIAVMDSIVVVNGAYPLIGLSQSGTLALRLGSARSVQQRYDMVWVDRAGRRTPVDPDWTFSMTDFGANYGWALSPDGGKLAIGLATDAGDDIWVKQLPRGPLSRVSYDSAADYRPRWMPDGRTIMFGSNRSGQGTGGLYTRRANGTGTDSLIRRADAGIYEAAWSPDGRWLLFRTGGTVGQAGGRDILGIRPGVDSAPVGMVATPYDEEAIALSPDGRWLAYESKESGRTEVFLRPFPATDAGKWQVSTTGGAAPLWARNGRELYYISASDDMMAVTVTQGAEPKLGEPRLLFHLADDLYFSSTEFYTPFDVAADGRFIMARRLRTAAQAEAPLIIVDNWLSELRSKMGTK